MNHRIECISIKIRICNIQSSPVFFSVYGNIRILRTERDHRALAIFQKVPVTPFKPGSPESLYMQL